jgi:hypothetical protein
MDKNESMWMLDIFVFYFSIPICREIINAAFKGFQRAHFKYKFEIFTEFNQGHPRDSIVRPNLQTKHKKTSFLERP